jgi:hypothetical protein
MQISIQLDTETDDITGVLSAILTKRLADLPVVVEPPTLVEVVKAVAKPKRKRRTKAQIAADEAAASPATPEVAADPPVNPVVETVAPVGETVPPVTPEQVKAAVVGAIERLTAAADPLDIDPANAPTQLVVNELVELTGKERIGEIDPKQYGVVVAGLAALGV